VELNVDDARAHGSVDAAKVEVKYTDLASKQRSVVAGKAELRFSGSDAEVKAGVNKDVVAAVTRQVATARNEEAVALRDKGKLDEARRVLRENADYLNRQAEQLPPASAAPLRELSKRNLDDEKNLSGSEWNKTRKSMRAQQYKDKTQQSY
jgi:Ca-activated chloride channel family protein